MHLMDSHNTSVMVHGFPHRHSAVSGMVHGFPHRHSAVSGMVHLMDSHTATALCRCMMLHHTRCLATWIPTLPHASGSVGIHQEMMHHQRQHSGGGTGGGFLGRTFDHIQNHVLYRAS